MATIGAASGADSPLSIPGNRPTAIGRSSPPWSLPVHHVIALRWALLALIAGNLGRIPLLQSVGRDIPIVINDVWITGLVLFGLVGCLSRRSLILDRVAFAALLFATVGFISAVLAVPRFGLTPLQLILSLSYLARWLVYFGIYVFIINHIHVSRVNAVWGSLERVMLVITGFGIFQSIFLPGFAQIVYSGPDIVGWDKQGHRLVSTLLDPNIVALMIVLVLLVQLARFSVGIVVPRWQPTLLLTGLALSLSRSGMLALLCGLMVIALARGLPVKLLRFFGALGILMVAALPKLISFAATYGKFNFGSDGSATVRLYAWAIAIATVMLHPIIGVGFNTFGYFKESMGGALPTTSHYSSDGGLLFVAVMTGFVGLTFYCAMLWLVIRRCRGIWRDMSISAEHRALAIGVAAGVVAIVINGLFINGMFTTFVMEILWVSWGLTFVIATAASRAAPRPAPVSGAGVQLVRSA